ncbi:MAG: hypothetical protein DRO88_05670 [Promethearchaeia archaeon]|nr:MAG: hypothetical protein DRO88_05670 [Candidatus Lokiarchaeia archaeon]
MGYSGIFIHYPNKGEIGKKFCVFNKIPSIYIYASEIKNLRISMLSPEMIERYQRQILVIGKEKQEELGSKTVLQVGLGGLGSPLANG